MAIQTTTKFLNIVAIAVISANWNIAFADQPARNSSGTAFAITKSGYLATNAHVIENAQSIVIVDSDGMKADAEVVAVDAANDLAIIKADIRSAPLYLDGAYQSRKGSEVSTLGFPNPGVQGRESKFTSGSISAESGLGNDIRFFQISVPVQPGNSGGALLDSKGSVVGIVTSKLNAAKILSATGDIPQNVNYAVKIKYLLAMVDGLPKVRDDLALPYRKLIKNNEEVVKAAEASTYLVRVTQKPSTKTAALPLPTSEGRDQIPPLPSGETLVVVNGKPIPMSRFYAMLNTMQKNGQQDTPKLRALIREELINREILMEESYRLGLATRENIRDPQTNMAHQSIVIRALVADFVAKNPVSDAEVQREYERFRSQAGNTEYHARHILVETEPEAAAIIYRMNNGETIESLAYLSKDSGSAKNGGDLNWAPPTAFVKPFGDSLKTLQKDTYTATPVKTQFGYHVIKLEDSRPAVVPALETVEKKIRESLMQQKLQTFQQGLRVRSTIQ